MQRVDIVLAISTAVAERAVADGMVAPSRVRVVPNGVGDHPMTATARGGHFLYLGRLEPEKRGRLAIQAVAAQHDAKLLIAGVGSEEPELRRLADDLMPGRCEFLGYVEEPTPLLAACRALLVPSASEGFGLVAIEAMAQATPVVGFHESGGLRDVIVNGSTGFLVDDDDEGGFTRAVAMLLRDGRLAESMGAAGRQRYESLFTVDRVAEATIDAYSAPR